MGADNVFESYFVSKCPPNGPYRALFVEPNERCTDNAGGADSECLGLADQCLIAL
jgi:hypothetical protein